MCKSINHHHEQAINKAANAKVLVKINLVAKRSDRNYLNTILSRICHLAASDYNKQIWFA